MSRQATVSWSAATFAFMVLVPLSFAFMYFLAVFSYGLAGDLAARQSMYPARMFTLPVTTAALAGWPMLYGTMAMARLWLATALLALWPSGVRRCRSSGPRCWPRRSSHGRRCSRGCRTACRGLRMIVDRAVADHASTPSC